MKKQKILELHNLCKKYGNELIFKNVSLTIYKGEVISIVGRSGSGKSTLLKCLNLLEKIDSGNILLENKNINDISLPELRQKVGLVFQDYNLLDTMTLQDNISLPLSLNGVYSQECISKCQALAQVFGLKEHLKKYPYQLSGGQKQRGATCRALISEPEIIFADEPTGALDSKSSRDLLERHKMVNDEGKATILMVTHDALSASYAKDVYILSDGMMKCRLTRGDSRKEFYDRIIDMQVSMGSDFS